MSSSTNRLLKPLTKKIKPLTGLEVSNIIGEAMRKIPQRKRWTCIEIKYKGKNKLEMTWK